MSENISELPKLAEEPAEAGVNHHTCGNCGKEYEGNYCPECGQSKLDIHRPFAVLLVDLLGNMYAFDTRVIKTLKAELFKPWQITLDYLSDKRVRYMPPFRMYVFISIIFFLLLGSYSGRQIDESAKKGNFIIELNTTSGSGSGSASAAEAVSGSGAETRSGEDARSGEGTAPAMKSAGKDQSAEELKINDIRKNPKEYMHKFYSYLSWSLFLLMPLYALLTRFFFRSSKTPYIGHFIFAICQHTFIFIISGILLAVAFIFPHKQVNPESWLLITIPVYAVAGMKKISGKSWISTTLRMFAVWFIYSIILIAAVVGVALLLILPA